jgi:predicted RNase H-like HicB family nuclease
MSPPLHPPADAGPVADGLRSWLPHWLELTFAQKREDGRWFVLIEEFDITGTGDTPEDARDQALDLLDAYLIDHFRSGTPFEQTLRPIPARLRFAVRLGGHLYRLASALGRPGAKEYKVLVRPSGLNGAVA